MPHSLTGKVTLASSIILLVLAMIGMFGISRMVAGHDALHLLTRNTFERGTLNARFNVQLADAIIKAQTFVLTHDARDREQAMEAINSAQTTLITLDDVVRERASTLAAASSQIRLNQQRRTEHLEQVRQIVAELVTVGEEHDPEAVLESLATIQQIKATHIDLQENIFAFLTYDLNLVLDDLDTRFRYSVVALVALICTCMAVTLMAQRGLRRYVVEPIKQLSIAAQQVARGDLQHEIAVSSRDEIGELQQSFNQMVIDLRTQHAMQESLEQDLRRMAYYDPLSQLPNRSLFMDRLAHALALTRRHNTSVAVLFLDLDNFKVINDSLGHHTGDRLVAAVAQRLCSCVRTEDTVARIGGDEFAILLEDIRDLGPAIDVAERIHEQLSEPIPLQNHEIITNVSIGIAIGSATDAQPDTLLRDADIAMYRAKSQGKGTYQLFDPSMDAQVIERLDLQEDLRRAIGHGELELFFQPIINLDDTSIAGMEALVRWRHPQRGIVSPASFIPLAEETGMILPLGQWVLTEACLVAQRWHTVFPDNPSRYVSVNLSVRQLQHPHFIDDLARILDQTGLDPACLELEITESAVMDSVVSMLAILKQIKQLGVRLAIDDFGTGYSSLSYLKRFPIDTLKIDRSFMEQLGRNVQDTAIVRAVVTLAHALDLDVTGEGIETPEQIAHLRALGCERGQGYHFARPMPVTDVDVLFAATTPQRLRARSTMSAILT